MITAWSLALYQPLQEQAPFDPATGKYKDPQTRYKQKKGGFCYCSKTGWSALALMWVLVFKAVSGLVGIKRKKKRKKKKTPNDFPWETLQEEERNKWFDKLNKVKWKAQRCCMMKFQIDYFKLKILKKIRGRRSWNKTYMKVLKREVTKI